MAPDAANIFAPLGLLKSSLQRLNLNVRVPTNGPSGSVRLLVRDKSLRQLYVGFRGSVSVQQIAQSLGFSWPFPADVLSLSDTAVNYTAGHGTQPMRLAVDATVAIPVISLNGSASILINGQDNVTVVVSACALAMGIRQCLGVCFVMTMACDCACEVRVASVLSCVVGVAGPVQSSKAFQIIPGLVLNPSAAQDGLRLVSHSNGTFTAVVDARVEGAASTLFLDANPDWTFMNMTTGG